MTVKAVSEALGLACAAGAAGLERQVTGGYVGDLLSWVMGRAGADSAWITVMGNVNAVAVAVLADVACIILCEGARLDEDAKTRAEENDVPVLCAEGPAFSVAVALGGLLEGK